MFETFQQAQDFMRAEGVRMVDIKWSGLRGSWQHVTLSAAAFTPELMQAGVGFDGSSAGLKPVSTGDMALIPDLGSAFLDPYYCEKTLSFIADIAEAESKAPFRDDPRRIARLAEDALRASGLADESLWGPEYEFFIFSAARLANSTYECACLFKSAELPDAEGNLGYAIPSHAGYHAAPPADRLADFRSQVCVTLEGMGVPVKYHHHEGGGPGHCEIEVPLMGMLRAADVSMLVKYAVRNCAARQGLSAVFLPKPIFGEAGCGMHHHQMLLKGGRNLFYDANSPMLLSSSALRYVGGLLQHAPALTALTNPSTNSYRRLMPGFEAPVNCFFGRGDRSAAVRVPQYATTENEVRVEYRPPDATCNPYLAQSAMLLAGLDGIQRAIDPAKAGFGPFEGDVFSWPEEKRAAIKHLPGSLPAAAAALDTDMEFLTLPGVFASDFLHTWNAMLRRDAAEVDARPHPFEIQKYFSQ